jgi:hypothetical protein
MVAVAIHKAWGVSKDELTMAPVIVRDDKTISD